MTEPHGTAAIIRPLIDEIVATHKELEAARAALAGARSRAAEAHRRQKEAEVELAKWAPVGSDKTALWAKHDELRARAEKAEVERDKALDDAGRHRAAHGREHAALVDILAEWERGRGSITAPGVITTARLALCESGGEE